MSCLTRDLLLIFVRLRQGRIGGTWRHIKEVLPQGGGRVCYIDGMLLITLDSANNSR